MIKVKHQLTMTTGLDYTVADVDCTTPSCLKYNADAGSQWYYHNAPYTLIESVISAAFGGTYNSYTDTRLKNLTGMSGNWIKNGQFIDVIPSLKMVVVRMGEARRRAREDYIA